MHIHTHIYTYRYILLLFLEHFVKSSLVAKSQAKFKKKKEN